MTASEPTITHDTGLGRYEIRLDDKVVGYTEYRDRAGRRIFVHTVVEPGHEGAGLGSRLIRGALDDTRAHGMRIVARCPFVRAFVERHREYLEPVD